MTKILYALPDKTTRPCCGTERFVRSSKRKTPEGKQFLWPGLIAPPLHQDPLPLARLLEHH